MSELGASQIRTRFVTVSTKEGIGLYDCVSSELKGLVWDITSKRSFMVSLKIENNPLQLLSGV
jgi:hypothetical protein